MVTIYSIAEQCRVSPSTVSRALSRPEMVSDEVRSKILRVAAEMGYHVNRNARRLANGSSGLIGVLVPDIANPYFGPLLRELDRCLVSDEVSILMADTADDVEREIATLRRLAPQVDGFILISPRAGLPRLQFELRHARAVLVNRPSRTINSVIIDESDAMIALFTTLIAQGHTRVGYVGGPAESWMGSRRRALAQDAAASAGAEVIDLGSYAAQLSSGVSAAAEVLSTRVTAALCFDDILALGVIDALRGDGVVVPRDISVIGCDDLGISVLTRPSLSSIGADMALVARESTGLLADSVVGALEGTTAEVKAEFRWRESLGPARRRPRQRR
jgi:DNA-binding LacI/PurR family transcriptional regulator